MPLHTPPADCTARSHHTHSRQVLDSTEATSPGAKPRLTRPAPISSTVRATWFQLYACQIPSSFWRIIVASPSSLTRSRNSSGTERYGSGCTR
jgi:hypothetical protein